MQASRSMRRRALRIEPLEDRAVPATFGSPWADARNLTLSFAPDGTSIASHASTLFRMLDGQQPTATWQTAILRAFQTWAVNANINIGLVADGGQPLGTTGMSQHDPRFGDIRVAAQEMDPSVLSVSVPNDTAVSSTMTGDVLINSSARFPAGPAGLFAAMLHESGHVFGLDHSTDPRSPLYPTASGVTALTPTDIQQLQALYGVRAPDIHEGSGSNDTISKATTIQPPGGYTGTTPLVAYGDVTTNKDLDFFSFRAPSGYAGGATIRLQSSGISLLNPRLTLLDAGGKVLGDVQATTDFGGVVTLHLGSISQNTSYYLAVRGATQDVFGIGSYGLAVTFDAKSTVAPATLNSTLSGPYQSLSPDEIAAILLGTASPLFHDDRGADDDPINAQRLTPMPGYARNSHYEVVGSTSGPTDADFYSIAVADQPSGGQPLVVTVTARALEVNGAAPRVTILDKDGNIIPTTILANGAGLYTVQAVGLKGGGNLLLKAGPNTSLGSPAAGNYALTAQFGAVAASLSTLATGPLSTTSPTLSYKLYVGQSQLMQLMLSASAGSPGSSVSMKIRDSSGVVIYSLTAAAGDTASASALFLKPGAYSVEFTAAMPAAGRPLTYSLLGEDISDPIGTVISDPTLKPVYQLPTMPGWYTYPTGLITTVPYLLARN